MSDQFRQWLAEELDARRISQGALARAIGVSQPYISRVMNGDKPPSVDFLVKVATALELSPVVVLTKAGIIPPQPGSDPRLEEITELIRQLSPEMQKDILDYVRFRYRQEKGQ